uniref:MADF domain-containing protein n=1 Tax=Anopheles dirus TaxID=7168 RepID=A0A182NWR1_9DIPT
MGIDTSDVRLKWQSLQGSHRHYLKIYADFSRADPEGYAVPRKKWFAFDAMSFLKPGDHPHSLDPLGELPDTSPMYGTEVDRFPSSECKMFEEYEYSDNEATTTNPLTISPTEPCSSKEKLPNKRRKMDANVSYDQDVLQTIQSVSNLAQDVLNRIIEGETEDMRILTTAGKEMRSWSPKRRKGVIAKFGSLMSEARMDRYQKYYGDESP